MANISHKTQKVVITEWIELENWQAKELHDIAFELSEACQLKGQETFAHVLFKVSDSVQRHKRISTKQLALLQKTMHVDRQETLYVAGLEYWILANVRKINQKTKERATRQKRGTL